MSMLEQELMRELLCFRSDLADLSGKWEKFKARLLNCVADKDNIDARLKRLDTETFKAYNILDERLDKESTQ
jgi:hypothetical protein